MSTGIDLVVQISDTHVGSTMGLLRPGFRYADDDHIKEARLNLPQQWLWDRFTDATERIREKVAGRQAALVIVGDVIEGYHHRTKQVWSQESEHQVDAAVYTLGPLCSLFEKVFVVRGTECHAGDHEHKFGVAVKAVVHQETEKHAAEHWLIRVNGTVCSFRHHISATARKYLEGGGLSIHAGHEQLSALRAGWPVPTVMGRAHRHTHGIYSDGAALVAVCGGWQHATRHVHKACPASVAAPSFIPMDFRGRAPGSLPDVSGAWVYQPAAPEALTI